MPPERFTMTSKYKILLHYALLPNPIGSIEDEIYELSLTKENHAYNSTKMIDGKNGKIELLYCKHCRNKRDLKTLNSILKDLKGKLEEY